MRYQFCFFPCQKLDLLFHDCLSVLLCVVYSVRLSAFCNVNESVCKIKLISLLASHYFFFHYTMKTQLENIKMHVISEFDATLKKKSNLFHYDY